MILKKLLAPLGKYSIAGELLLIDCLLDIREFFAGVVGFVEADHFPI